MLRLESYTLSTEPVKRYKVRTHGKRTSKVKTSHIVLRRGEQDYAFGKPTEIISNKHLFNQLDKECDKDFNWAGTKRLLPVRGQSVKYSTTSLLPMKTLDNVNTFLREVLKFKRITHERMLTDYNNFETKRTAQLERIAKLLKSHRNSPERIILLRKLKDKWSKTNAHCRYIVSTNVMYDFKEGNSATDIEARGLRLGSILVEKVFPDGGVFFNRKQCAGINMWIDLNKNFNVVIS